MKKVLKLGLLLVATVVLSACNPLAKPQKAGLQVITNDVNSTVFVNGDYLEKTPLIKRDLKPGSYNIKIHPDDPEYVPYETTVTLRPGLLTVVTWRPGKRAELSGGVIFEMEPIKSKTSSEVSVVSIPDGAIIKLGDGDKEFSPMLYQDVTPGQSDLEITLPSYETQQHTIDVIPGYRLLINVKLAKAPADKEPAISEVNAADDQTASESAKNTDESTAKYDSTRENVLVEQASASATTGPTILIKATGFFMNGNEVLRVRDKAGATGKQIGYATVGENYPYLNESNGGWYKISFEGQEGWVSSQYATLNE